MGTLGNVLVSQQKKPEGIPNPTNGLIPIRTQDELNSMDMDALKALADSNVWQNGLGGAVNNSANINNAQRTYDTRRTAELQAQTDAANAQKAAAEQALAAAQQQQKDTETQKSYVQQGRTQAMVQNANAINVSQQIRDYQNKAPGEASTDVSQVTADGADSGGAVSGAEDQRKRPGGFTQRATGIRIS